MMGIFIKQIFYLLNNKQHLTFFSKIYRYKVYNIVINDKNQLDTLSALEYIAEHIDFWDTIHRVGQNSRVMVAPQVQGQFENVLKELMIEYTIPIENVET